MPRVVTQWPGRSEECDEAETREEGKVLAECRRANAVFVDEGEEAGRKAGGKGRCSGVSSPSLHMPSDEDRDERRKRKIKQWTWKGRRKEIKMK